MEQRADKSVALSLRRYQEIDKRIRHFKQLGKHANSEKSLDEMRAAALVRGRCVQFVMHGEQCVANLDSCANVTVCGR